MLSAAFNSKLKELAINEFPCGDGKWRSGNTWRCDSPDLLNRLKEPDASLESTQSLLEILEMEPFAADGGWSEDTASIRKLVIKNPERITKNSIYRYFTKLRLLGMGIVEVDSVLLKFINLKELALSANRIQDVNLKNVPRTLEVLELYGNGISSIDKFCCSLPLLLHLGIGSNSLLSVNTAVHQNCWSNLLSLDLSFNGLTSLKETLDTLKQLPKLSVLLLKGNPLFLASIYRGFLIDTLRGLTILDDVPVTADEKHRFKDMAKLKGISIDEAVFEIQLDSLKGIKAAQNSENETGTEGFPKTEYRYQVVYPFLMNCTVRKPPKRICEIVDNDREPDVTQEIEERLSASETDDEIFRENVGLFDEGNCVVKRKTKEKIWCEDEIRIEHERKLITTDLADLKKFLLDGFSFDLIENKVLVSLDPPEDNSSCIGDGDNDKSVKGAKSKQPQKDKPKQPPVSKMNASKGKKKNKEEVHLYELSRDSKTLATINLKLDDFVHGEKYFEKQCVCVLDTTNDSESEAQNEDGKDPKLSTLKKRPSFDGKKKGKDSRKPSPSPAGLRNKSASSNKHGKAEKQEKNTKAKEAKILAEIAENEAEPQSSAEITLHVSICLHSWQNSREVQDWITDKH